MKRRCFYHAGCPDGFGAAWSVWQAWGGAARYVAQSHEDSIDLGPLEGEQVVFADIAPSTDVLRDLIDVADEVIVLDHHLSARDRYAADLGLQNALDGSPHRVHFDLDHSGAVLAWNHFHPGDALPDLLGYVEDQDLWNWKLPRSEEINAAIGSYERHFKVWNELAARPIEELAREGEPILRAHRMDVERALRTAHPVAVERWRVEAVNSPVLRSALGHELAKRAAFGRPCGLVYRITGDRVNVSIYSIGDLDVSRVAAAFGGGGHCNAAGFTVSLARWLESFV